MVAQLNKRIDNRPINQIFDIVKQPMIKTRFMLVIYGLIVDLALYSQESMLERRL